MLALELAVNGRPVRLRASPLAWFGSGACKQPLLQNRIRDIVRKRPAQPCRFEPPDRQPHRWAISAGISNPQFVSRLTYRESGTTRRKRDIALDVDALPWRTAFNGGRADQLAIAGTPMTL
jgi:hypothetical protein